LAEAYLRAGHRVRALVRAGRSLPSDAARSDALSVIPVDYGDARDVRRALTGVDVVIHAAGATRSPPPARLGLTQANVGITRRVARAVAKGSARLVFISSQAAAGPAMSADKPVRESDVPAPVEAYGVSKLEAERAVAEELPREQWTVIRPAAVYGPRERDFVALFSAARAGLAVHPGNREQSIGIVHVDDLVCGIMSAAGEPIAGGKAYFLANEAPITWGELFQAAARACETSVRFDLQIPRFAIDAIGRIGDVHARVTRQPGLLTTQKLALSKPKWWHCSSEAAARELGFVQTIELPEGLRLTYHWYREAGWL
jgi:nucleoside-diphosphate-sugar epimerase